MRKKLTNHAWVLGLVVVVASTLTVGVRADETNDFKQELRQLQEQNGQLQQQLLQQQQLIENLTHRLSDMEGANQKRGQEIGTLKAEVEQVPAAPTASSKPFSLGKVVLSGEGALGVFESGSEGQHPNADFRVDEARLFVDAQVWNDVYFFGGIDITTRENPSQNLRINELYIDFENVSKLWNVDRLLNVRAGQFYTPFGEEYQDRYAIDDPLISHSLSDIWGVDDGIEVYGSSGQFDYALAVQNGGMPDATSFHADKSVAGRVGYTPMKWLRLSASAMRTGNLNVPGDSITALWFGNGFFMSLGAPPTTTSFHANLAEGDLQLKFSRGELKAAGGYAHFDDNNTAADDGRDISYYYVEGLYDVTKQLYGAAEFSQIMVPNGYPIVGQGDSDYFGELTKNIWRLSLDIGYRFSNQLVLKAEYSMERGTEEDGEARNHEDQIALQLAYGF
jgi:hypothetical protein